MIIYISFINLYCDGHHIGVKSSKINLRRYTMEQLQTIISEVKKVIIGKDRVLWMVLCAMLAKGHILLEDIPGVGKTSMALAFSKALGLDYGRMQFTPDVMPSDITGFSIPDRNTGKLTYQKGAIMCNLFLADELNRATSRTQSALLEAMEEQQVTVDGISHPIPSPFTVIATQNPTGAAGTQLLPDSQLDRFSVRLSIGYPSPKSERDILLSRQNGNSLEKVRQIVGSGDFEKLRSCAEQVYINQDIIDYIVELVNVTRSSALIYRGASPRATLSLCDMSKSIAFINNRDYVIPSDVQSVFSDTIAHRLLLSDEAESRGMTDADVCACVLREVRPPKVN